MRTFRNSIFRIFVLLFVSFIFSFFISIFFEKKVDNKTFNLILLALAVLFFLFFLHKYTGTKIILNNEFIEHYEKRKLIQKLKLSDFNFSVHTSGIPMFSAHWLCFWNNENRKEIIIDTSSLGFIKTYKIAKLIKPYTINKGIQSIPTTKVK